MHLQVEQQAIPELKHSQYFFKHLVFLQLHPLKCGAGWIISDLGLIEIFERKAKGSLFKIAFILFSLVS